MLAVLGADVLREHLQTALGRRVCGNGLAAQLAHHGADVDDLAVALLDHGGDDGLGNDEGSVQVHVDNLTELSGGHLAHGNTLDDTGVVNQDVDHADFLLNGGNQRIDGILIGNVAHITVGFDASLFVSGDSLVHQLLLDVVKADGRAALGHTAGNGEADAVGSAGNQGDLTFQREIFEFHDEKPPNNDIGTNSRNETAGVRALPIEAGKTGRLCTQDARGKGAFAAVRIPLPMYYMAFRRHIQALVQDPAGFRTIACLLERNQAPI